MRLRDGLFRIGTGAHRVVYRASGGRLLGRAAGMPVVILNTIGRRSGRPRHSMLTTPVHDDDSVVLVASYGGAPRDPAWFLNLRDHPDVTLTIGTTTRPMRARVTGAAEKAQLWPRIVDANPGYGGYQQKTDRQIPVVVLESYIGDGSPDA